jgi:hypothetical protein
MMPGTARAHVRIVNVLVVAGLLVATAPALAAGSNMPPIRQRGRSSPDTALSLLIWLG